MHESPASDAPPPSPPPPRQPPVRITWVVVLTNIWICLLPYLTGWSPWVDLVGDSPSAHSVHAMQVMGALGAGLTTAEPWRLWTSTVLHWWGPHLLGNMIALFMLGSFLERLRGPRFWLAAYLLAGGAGSLWSVLRGEEIDVGVGASGAVFGIAGALLVSLLRMRRLFRPVGLVISVTLLALVIAGNLLLHHWFAGESGIQIDQRAHVAGLMGGVVLGVLPLPARAPGARWWGAALLTVFVGISTIPVVRVLVRQPEGEPLAIPALEVALELPTGWRASVREPRVWTRVDGARLEWRLMPRPARGIPAHARLLEETLESAVAERRLDGWQLCTQRDLMDQGPGGMLYVYEVWAGQARELRFHRFADCQAGRLALELRTRAGSEPLAAGISLLEGLRRQR